MNTGGVGDPRDCRGVEAVVVIGKPPDPLWLNKCLASNQGIRGDSTPGSCGVARKSYLKEQAFHFNKITSTRCITHENGEESLLNKTNFLQ